MERGKLIQTADPQPEIRKNAENAADFKYRDMAQYVYPRCDLLRDRLIDPIARIDRDKMPKPVISFDDLRNYNTLAAYTLVRNPQGLNYEITLNSQHIRTDRKEGEFWWAFGEWALNETLTHELVHEWQQTVGEQPVQLGKIYHNKEFVDKCESLGLHPKPGEGYHIKLADGPFEVLMNELGIEKPKELPGGEFDIDWFKWLQDFKGKKRKGRSTLNKWCCPECGLNVRMGIKGDPELRHHPCEVKTGKEVFLVSGDIYVAKK